MNTKTKDYKVILLNSEAITNEDRITIQAATPEEAVQKLKDIYGNEVKYSIWNEEDVNKIR